MDLTIELNKLQAYMDKRNTDEFKAYVKELYDKSSIEEKNAITEFIESNLKDSTTHIRNTVNDIQVRIQLETIIDILPLAYISKQYFNKTRQWLYQRINGYTVNGKSARFTESEINTFNYALQDISQRIGSAAIHS